MGEPIEKKKLLAERIGYFTACWLDKVGERAKETRRKKEAIMSGAKPNGGWNCRGGSNLQQFSPLTVTPLGMTKTVTVSGVSLYLSESFLQGDPLGCRTGNGEKVSRTQAEPGQAINSAVV